MLDRPCGIIIKQNMKVQERIDPGGGGDYGSRLASCWGMRIYSHCPFSCANENEAVSLFYQL